MCRFAPTIASRTSIASAERSVCESPTTLCAACRSLRTVSRIALAAMALATSPALYPPIPSATIAKPIVGSVIAESSLCGRFLPVSETFTSSILEERSTFVRFYALVGEPMLRRRSAVKRGRSHERPVAPGSVHTAWSRLELLRFRTRDGKRLDVNSSGLVFIRNLLRASLDVFRHFRAGLVTFVNIFLQRLVDYGRDARFLLLQIRTKLKNILMRFICDFVH